MCEGRQRGWGNRDICNSVNNKLIFKKETLPIPQTTTDDPSYSFTLKHFES